MLDTLNDFRLYLPKYLSIEEQNKLFNELSSFPSNLDKRFYTAHLKNEPHLFQGDGYAEISMPDYQQKCLHKVKGFLLSNTCDSSFDNKRLHSPIFLSFTPIHNLKKYEENLLKKYEKEIVLNHINSIKKQKNASFFFIPAIGELDDCFIRLDYIFSLPATEQLVNELISNRLFSLSNYAFYLLLFKISIHFTRVQEGVNRD